MSEAKGLMRNAVKLVGETIKDVTMGNNQLVAAGVRSKEAFGLGSAGAFKGLDPVKPMALFAKMKRPNGWPAKTPKTKIAPWHSFTDKDDKIYKDDVLPKNYEKETRIMKARGRKFVEQDETAGLIFKRPCLFGLGQPHESYDKSRINVGKLFIDYIAKQYR